VSGSVGPHGLIKHRDDDDYVQAGALYRVIKEDARQRLVDNIAGSLAQVTKPDVVARTLEHFRKADSEYGERIAVAFGRLRG